MRTRPVEAAVRKASPRTFLTVPGGAPFEVRNLSHDAVELLFGKSKTRTVIRWVCLEGIPAFLDDRDCVEIGAIQSATIKPGTLEAYPRTCLRLARGRTRSRPGRVHVARQPYDRLHLWSMADYFDRWPVLAVMTDPYSGRPLNQPGLF